mmetsp:Transcript_103077/g.320615  ORF Transcript_103077/g.320615 Transcript_103077/m.320615 type:complete len:277 (+) Transcript_103077:957-1787(+)
MCGRPPSALLVDHGHPHPDHPQLLQLSPQPRLALPVPAAAADPAGHEVLLRGQEAAAHALRDRRRRQGLHGHRAAHAAALRAHPPGARRLRPQRRARRAEDRHGSGQEREDRLLLRPQGPAEGRAGALHQLQEGQILALPARGHQLLLGREADHRPPLHREEQAAARLRGQGSPAAPHGGGDPGRRRLGAPEGREARRGLRGRRPAARGPRRLRLLRLLPPPGLQLRRQVPAPHRRKLPVADAPAFQWPLSFGARGVTGGRGRAGLLSDQPVRAGQ